MSEQKTETHEFQAEVRKVLDIVVNSLYTEKEIFLRELVSNASDSLEKLRHIQLKEKDVFEADKPLEISISTDETAGTIAIADTGVGFTREELIKNIGTIAHSGSKAFLEALKQSGEGANESLIGQFGVGFYSVFMVAKEVKVYTHAWKADTEGLVWTSDGSGSYTIEPSENQPRGSKIVAVLKDEYKEFSKADRVKEILSHYSSFVAFPILLNGERVNTQEALWLKPRSEITDEKAKEFYKFQAQAWDDPLAWFHFSADAPLAVNSLLFIPGSNPEAFGFTRMEPAVSLYCRKVLIDPSPKKLLPEWMRFVKGVVDSADLPLNISRETIQESALIAKLRQVISKRFVKFLQETAKKDPEKYEKIWRTFGLFFKEGAATDISQQDALSRLLRFESSALEKGKLTSFEEYVSRMRQGQKDIYYLIAPAGRQAAENSPYLEGLKARGIEVLFAYDPIDEWVFLRLAKFEDKAFFSIDRDDLKLEEPPAQNENAPLDKDAADKLCQWLKEKLGDKKVSSVGIGDRLVDSPAVAMSGDRTMTPQMRRMMKAMQAASGTHDSEETSPVILQINPRHPLIKQLETLRADTPDHAQFVAEQLFDNALLAAGLLEDAAQAAKRGYAMLERFTQKAEQPNESSAKDTPQ